MELPPGWYPDPLSPNGKSWWNGSSWVSEEELREATGSEPVEEFHATTTATYVPEPPGRVVPPPKQPVFRPLRVLGAIIASVVVMAGLFVLGLMVHPDLGGSTDHVQPRSAATPTTRPGALIGTPDEVTYYTTYVRLVPTAAMWSIEAREIAIGSAHGACVNLDETEPMDEVVRLIGRATVDVGVPVDSAQHLVAATRPGSICPQHEQFIDSWIAAGGPTGW